MKIQDPHRVLYRIVVGKVPIDAQLVVTRRCNLSCGYCTEYDGHSAEVPYDQLIASIDALHRLGVINITLLGGEPLLHSRIADVIRHASRHAQVSMTTNAFLLSDAMISVLNEAGLSNMQLSIDALESDADRYIQKTFKSLRPKLERLAQLARFPVHCNLVLCEQTLAQFDEIVAKLADFPFALSVNLIHDDNGQVEIRGAEYLEKWNEHFASGRAVSFIEKAYGAALLKGERPEWQCRAGARYLYIDEFGKVQFCSSQRGRLDKPIVEYTRADIKAHSQTRKGCETRCSIFCVYRVSQADNAPVKALGRLAQSALRGAFLNRNPRPGGREVREASRTPSRSTPVRSSRLRVVPDQSKG